MPTLLPRSCAFLKHVSGVLTGVPSICRVGPGIEDDTRRSLASCVLLAREVISPRTRCFAAHCITFLMDVRDLVGILGLVEDGRTPGAHNDCPLERCTCARVRIGDMKARAGEVNDLGCWWCKNKCGEELIVELGERASRMPITFGKSEILSPGCVFRWSVFVISRSGPTTSALQYTMRTLAPTVTPWRSSWKWKSDGIAIKL